MTNSYIFYVELYSYMRVSQNCYLLARSNKMRHANKSIKNVHPLIYVQSLQCFLGLITYGY